MQEDKEQAYRDGFGPFTPNYSTKDAPFTMSLSFTATATSHDIQVIGQVPAGAGTKAYVDDLRVVHLSGLYVDLEGVSYGALNGTLYGDHESSSFPGDVYVRVAQVAPSQDSFTVSRVSLFDDPIQWSFSVDDGGTWYDANEIRNNPRGVLSLPDPGTVLRWRAKAWRPGAWVGALAIRPWYGGMLGARPGHHGLSCGGPNRSVVDQYPPIERDPMWQQWDQPIPRWWFNPLAAGPVPPPPPPPVVPLAPAAPTNYTSQYRATYRGIDPTTYPATYQPTY